MKNNKELISEIIKDIKHDMTDEEILALLAGSKISVNPAKKAKSRSGSARRTRSQNLRGAGRSSVRSSGCYYCG